MRHYTCAGYFAEADSGDGDAATGSVESGSVWQAGRVGSGQPQDDAGR